LPRIERCADVKLLRAVVTPPDDPTIRAAVDRIRGQLAEVRIASRVGQVAAALKAIAPLEQEVRRLGYEPLVAEVLLERASVLLERGDWEAAGRIWEEAVWLAELSRHDEVAAEAATQLVGIMAFQTRFDAADIWSRHAEIILRRMGGQDRLWAWLFNNRGVVRQCQGRLGDGLAHMQQAIAAKEKAFGSGHPDVALSQSNVAVLMVEMGQLAEALPYVQRAIANSESSLGPDHPRTASFLVNGGEILNKLGRHEEARCMAQRALSIFEREAEADGAYVTTALVALGVGYLDDGMVDAALPLLERAAKNRETNETEPSRLAEAHFALARALFSPGHDQERAHALALRARTECEQGAQSPATQRALAAINQWLASQRP
jgi:tetratricopeptide (TPR) repeat protein